MFYMYSFQGGKNIRGELIANGGRNSPSSILIPCTTSVSSRVSITHRVSSNVAGLILTLKYLKI